MLPIKDLEYRNSVSRTENINHESLPPPWPCWCKKLHTPPFSGSAGTDALSVAADSSYEAEIEGRSSYGGGCGCGCGNQGYILPFLLGALALATWFLNMQVELKTSTFLVAGCLFVLLSHLEF